MTHPLILTAIDMRPGSFVVIDEALRIALERGAKELHVLSVAEPAVAVGVDMSAAPYAELFRVDTKAMASYVRERADALKQQRPDAVFPTIEVHGSVGRPADEIVWLAAHLDADAIVVGTHNQKGITRFLLGSVAEKVVRLAGCEVVVVRPKNHRAEWRVPEIEPLCPDCAEARKASAGSKLWCARHAEHHVRAHVFSYAGGGESPHAWSSSTGT